MKHPSRTTTAIAAATTLLLGASLPAQASLSYVGSCADAATQACVATDGSFEYLTMGGARVKSDALPALLAQGWELGTRTDFVGMITRNAPVFAVTWNDIFLANGDILFGVAGTTLQSSLPHVTNARTGSTTIAASFKDIVLKLGGSDANPAYFLTLGTAEIADGATHRSTVSVQAYYTDAGTSLARNNVFSGPQGTGTRPLALEPISANNYFLLRPVSPVPEPQTYALFAAGLGIVGLMIRRRNAAGRHAG